MNATEKIKSTEVTVTVGEFQEEIFNAAKESLRVFLKKTLKTLRANPDTPCTFGGFADLFETSLKEIDALTIDNWADQLYD